MLGFDCTDQRGSETCDTWKNTGLCDNDYFGSLCLKTCDKCGCTDQRASYFCDTWKDTMCDDDYIGSLCVKTCGKCGKLPG